jgi:hypothetical protein
MLLLVSADETVSLMIGNGSELPSRNPLCIQLTRMNIVVNAKSIRPRQLKSDDEALEKK